ncbi:MAG: MFS transporter [Kiritimatiellia bacterium]
MLPRTGGRLRAWGVLLLVYAGYVSLGLPDCLLGVAWQPIRRELGCRVEWASLLTSAILCCSATGSLLYSRVLARYPVGRVLACCGLATGLALVATGCARGLVWLLILVIPYGFGQGTVDTGMNCFAAQRYSARQMNWLHCFWGIGATIGPAVLTLCLARNAGWRLAYWCLGGAQLLLALLFTFATDWLQPSARRVQTPRSGASSDRLAYLLSASIFLSYVGMESLIGLWGHTYLVEQGYPMDRAGAVITLYWALLTLGRLLWGCLADRLGHHRLVRQSALGGILGATLILVGLPLAGIAAAGFLIGPIYPTLMHAASRRFRPDIAVRLTGLQGACGMAGGALIPPLAGIIMARIGFQTLPAFVLLSSLAALLAEHQIAKRIPCQAS